MLNFIYKLNYGKIMKIETKQVTINKTLNNDTIEQSLSEYGEPLRWAIVDVTNNKFVIEAVFIKN